MSEFDRVLFWFLFAACLVGVPLFIYFADDGPAKRRRGRVTVPGPFERGQARRALVLTCYRCGLSQAFLDRPGEHVKLLLSWTQDAGGWRHWRCG